MTTNSLLQMSSGEKVYDQTRQKLFGHNDEVSLDE